MKHLRTILIALLLLASPNIVRAEETDDASKNTIEFPSPDGQFAFRYSGEESDDAKRTFDLINKSTGKVVRTVARSNAEIGPTARFEMEVLWRADSKAFAVTATLWKRGSTVKVFTRDGSTFREIKLPELLAEVPDKVKGGKTFPHVNQLNSQSAKEWQQDGSLVVLIETIVDGESGTLTATRTVALGFDGSRKAKILKSTIDFATE